MDGGGVAPPGRSVEETFPQKYHDEVAVWKGMGVEEVVEFIPFQGAFTYLVRVAFP
jgi:hypothetical protein